MCGDVDKVLSRFSFWSQACIVPVGVFLEGFGVGVWEGGFGCASSFF